MYIYIYALSLDSSVSIGSMLRTERPGFGARTGPTDAQPASLPKGTGS
jgi:hypothetical protein